MNKKISVERRSLFLCVWISMHSITPSGAARVEGKKVAERHVPQYVFVPHAFLFLHFDINTIALCVC